MSANENDNSLKAAKRAFSSFSKNLSPVSTRQYLPEIFNGFFNTPVLEIDIHTRMRMSDLYRTDPKKHLPQAISRANDFIALKRIAQSVDILIDEGNLISSNDVTATSLINTFSSEELQFRGLTPR